MIQDNLVIDDFIKREQASADEYQIILDNVDYYGEDVQYCENQAKEHNQIANWLIELSQYRKAFLRIEERLNSYASIQHEKHDYFSGFYDGCSYSKFILNHIYDEIKSDKQSICDSCPRKTCDGCLYFDNKPIYNIKEEQ